VSEVRLLAVGYLNGACITTGSGATWCWDRDHTDVVDGIPTIGTFFSPSTLADAVELSACFTRICAVRRDGSVKCLDYDKQAADPPMPLVDIAQVAVAEDHACARTHGGRLICWGDTQWGQSDEGDVDDATWVAATDAVTCAARARGVECRGREMRR
jgi:hypothetical protein